MKSTKPRTGGIGEEGEPQIVLRRLQHLNDDNFTAELVSATIRELRKSYRQTGFSAMDRDDLTLYLGCLLRSRVRASGPVLDCFISRALLVVEPAILRQNYYNHRKNKRLTTLQSVLGYSDQELSEVASEEMQRSFITFYRAWIEYVLEDATSLRAAYPEVFSVVDSKGAPSPAVAKITDKNVQIQLQIARIEAEINARLGLRQRGAVHPRPVVSAMSSSGNAGQPATYPQIAQPNFPASNNSAAKQQQKQKQKPQALPAAQRVDTKIPKPNNVTGFKSEPGMNLFAEPFNYFQKTPPFDTGLKPAGISDLFPQDFELPYAASYQPQTIPSVHNQYYNSAIGQPQELIFHDNDPANASTLSDYGVLNTTGNKEQQLVALSALGQQAQQNAHPVKQEMVFRPVINDADLEEVSNALLQLAQQSEKSDRGQIVPGHSLFSSFL